MCQYISHDVLDQLVVPYSTEGLVEVVDEHMMSLMHWNILLLLSYAPSIESYEKLSAFYTRLLQDMVLNYSPQYGDVSSPSDRTQDLYRSSPLPSQDTSMTCSWSSRLLIQSLMRPLC